MAMTSRAAISNRIKRAATVLAVVWLLVAAAMGQETPAASLGALRAFYLTDLHELRNYRPGKNSFVEGPDRRLGCYTKPGQRLTLLDAQGPGELRHIWSTWREGSGNHRLEMYLDGETKPRIVGTLDELIAAAERDPNPAVLVPGFVGNRQARNYFVPVAFQTGLRIEMETLEPTWLIFWQFDYRLGRWEPTRRPVGPTVSVSAKDSLNVVGPAVIRRLTVSPDAPFDKHDQLELEICYDGVVEPAVRARVSDFFGPFEGASLWSDKKSGRRECYLTIPVRRDAVVSIRGGAASISAEVERLDSWNPNFGFFCAQEKISERTVGYRQHEVLDIRGRGHWLGMALYNTGHDHGGGDFAVLDAEGDNPAFLHGVNGEDYFTFAWFGRGKHLPFAVAHSNEEGRVRHHVENPYPFSKSIRVYWGVYPDLRTRSVAYWYQDTPSVVEPRPDAASDEWDCFGPVPLELDAEHRPVGDPFAVLPNPADLDAGRKFECRCVSERFTAGWMKQRSFGPMLDATYLARHGTKIKGEIELGGMGHAFLARRSVESTSARRAVFQLSHDDPIRVEVNGRTVFEGGQNQGFATVRFPVDLKQGKNEVLVRFTNFFNVNFNWAGFCLRVVE